MRRAAQPEDGKGSQASIRILTGWTTPREKTRGQAPRRLNRTPEVRGLVTVLHHDIEQVQGLRRVMGDHPAEVLVFFPLKVLL